jgi:hypothetical protein
MGLRPNDEVDKLAAGKLVEWYSESCDTSEDRAALLGSMPSSAPSP